MTWKGLQLILSLLASFLLAVVLGSLLVPGMASASTAAGAETCVGAFDFADQVGAGVEASLTLELRQGYGLAYDDLACDSLLAGRGGGAGLGGSGGGAGGAGRGGNKLQPHPDATGPHSTWKTDGNGNVTGHAEWGRQRESGSTH